MLCGYDPWICVSAAQALVTVRHTTGTWIIWVPVVTLCTGFLHLLRLIESCKIQVIYVLVNYTK